MIIRTLQLAVLASFGIGARDRRRRRRRWRRPARGRAIDVTCDDGRRGIHSGDAIVWADGSTSRLASPHPSVIIGNKSSVVIGPGVFAGNGKGGHVPMENPSAPSKARCPILDGCRIVFED